MESNGIEYVIYEVQYDTVYYLSEVSSEEEAEDAETTTVHTQELACYSKTDDSVEIILYMESFDLDTALDFLHQFLGI